MEQDKSYKEFCGEILKKRPRGKNKVTGSWGIYDAYKKIRRNKWYNIGRPLKEKEFYAIIRSINKLLADELAKGNTVVFPQRMGKLELCKSKCGVSIVDNELKITYPVDWSSTLKLWYEDEEARRNKTLLRFQQDYIYRIKYRSTAATYENKLFYRFDLNTFIQNALSSNIRKGIVDALWDTNSFKMKP